MCAAQFSSQEGQAVSTALGFGFILFEADGFTLTHVRRNKHTPIGAMKPIQRVSANPMLTYEGSSLFTIMPVWDLLSVSFSPCSVCASHPIAAFLYGFRGKSFLWSLLLDQQGSKESCQTNVWISKGLEMPLLYELRDSGETLSKKPCKLYPLHQLLTFASQWDS